jgi:hypothetical protein
MDFDELALRRRGGGDRSTLNKLLGYDMTPCRTAVDIIGLLKLRVPQEPWNFLTK